MGKSKELATLTDDLEQNLGNKIVAGDRTSTTGSQVLAAYYNGSGELGTIGGNASNGGLSVGYGVWPKPDTANAYVSSTDVPLYRSAVSLSGTIDMYMGTAQTVTTGSDVPMDKVFSIDESGRVTIPYQPAFRAYVTEHTYSSNYVNSFSTSGTYGSFQIGNHLTSDRFTAPVAGRYAFSISGLCNHGGGGYWARIKTIVNGSTVHDGLSDNYSTLTQISYQRIAYTVVLNLSANDYVQLYFQSSSQNGYLYRGGGYTMWSGYLIG